MFISISGFGLSVSKEFARNKNLTEINGSVSAI